MSTLYLYKPGHCKASWAFLKGNCLLQFLLKSKSHWGRRGTVELGPLFLHSDHLETSALLPKGRPERQTAGSLLHTLVSASHHLFCWNSHSRSAPVPAPAWSTSLPCTLQRGVWLQECPGRPSLGVLMTDGLVFLSVEVAACGCQAYWRRLGEPAWNTGNRTG